MAKRNLPFGGATPMDPGERDRATTLQRATGASDAAGFPTETWATLVTPVWMRREDIGGKERFAAAQVTATYTTRWEMGYRSDMDPELVNVKQLRRLVYQGRAYDIVEASIIGRREGIELLTIESRT